MPSNTEKRNSRMTAAQREWQSLYRNGEGYISPTEGAALSRIMREERMAARRERAKNTQRALNKPTPIPSPSERYDAQGGKQKQEEDA